MSKDSASIVRVGIVGLILMVALGVGFRILIARQASKAETSGSESAEASEPKVVEPPPPALDDPETCLAKPRARWTEEESTAYPELAAWLDAQSRRVLPWEWSDEAVAKDPVGYCRLWEAVCWDLQKEALAGVPIKNIMDVMDGPVGEVARLRLFYNEKAAELTRSATLGSSRSLREADASSRRILLEVIMPGPMRGGVANSPQASDSL